MNPEEQGLASAGWHKLDKINDARDGAIYFVCVKNNSLSVGGAPMPPVHYLAAWRQREESFEPVLYYRRNHLSMMQLDVEVCGTDAPAITLDRVLAFHANRIPTMPAGFLRE